MLDPGIVGPLHSRVVDLTFDFFHGMGSRVALAKCKTMSTHPDVRAELRQAKFRQQNEEVPV
eukprot:10475643-Alexandrium_andersonii.AAC.1